MADTDQTSSGLRDILFQTLAELRSGKCEVSKAKAIAAVAHQIISTVHMEIDVARLRRDYPGDTKLVLPPPLQLKTP